MKYVSYYRVSTQKQGQSGLGLKAQKSCINNLISKTDKLIKEFVEVETGTGKRERPILQEAIQYAKEQEATLIVGKLDRLARNVAFTSQLMESKVKFVCCDMPNANDLTIHILSAIAENEATMISKRTSEAIRETDLFKSGNWGNNNLTKEAIKKGQQAIKDKANNNLNYKRASILIESKRKEGLSYQSIANLLNKQGYETSKNKQFNPIQVKRFYDRHTQ